MTYALPMLVSIAADRMARLARPRDGSDPVVGPAAPEEWARLAGLQTEPHPLLVKTRPLDTSPYTPEAVAMLALRKLTERSVVEAAGRGLWRPVLRRVRAPRALA